MNTAVIITKTEPGIKQRAQEIAHELGISLSSLVNAYLKQIVRTKRVEFNLNEVPSDYLVKTIKQAEKNFKARNTSPTFRNADESLKWLEKQGI